MAEGVVAVNVAITIYSHTIRSDVSLATATEVVLLGVSATPRLVSAGVVHA
jgi:hypothetical protein